MGPVIATTFLSAAAKLSVRFQGPTTPSPSTLPLKVMVRATVGTLMVTTAFLLSTTSLVKLMLASAAVMRGLAALLR